MQDIKINFNKIKKKNDPELINDFLIRISNQPSIEHFDFIDYFISNLKPEIKEKIKINLIYTIGELAKSHKIDVKYINYLIEQYYISDRWIRNEIIVALDKISINFDLSNEIIDFVSKTLNEDYVSIKISAIKLLEKCKVIPKTSYKNIFRTLNMAESETIESISKILDKEIKDENKLFDVLNLTENYKLLNKKSIRIILFNCINNLSNLEIFKNLISKSDWNEKEKNLYLKEINDYERIILKKF